MIKQNSNKQPKPSGYAAFAYENGTGKPVKVRSPDALKALLEKGHCDCPTKAKAKGAAKSS